MKAMASKIWKRQQATVMLPLFLFTIVIIGYHVVMVETAGDAISSFSHYIDHTSLYQALRVRYMGWSSRVLIEAALILLSHNMHTILWKTINVLMYVLLYGSLAKLTSHKHDYLLAGLLLLYPLADMNTAGWMATYINYLWPAALGVYAATLLWDFYQTDKVTPLKLVMTTLALIFATNFETFGIMYLVILGYFLICMVLKKRMTATKYMIVGIQSVVCILNLVSAILSPGNIHRSHVEVRFMPDFSMMSIFDKVSLGVTSTFSYLIDNSLIFALFAVVLVLVTYKVRSHQLLPIIVSAIPLLLIIYRKVPESLTNPYFSRINHALDMVAQRTFVNGSNYFGNSVYVSFVLYLIVIGCILITMMNAFVADRQGILLDVVFGAALLTRIAMGFSPTVFASEQRTFMFLNVALIYCTVQLYQLMLSDNDLLESKTLLGKQFNQFLGVIFAALVIAGIAENFYTLL